jgi:hypothetical protein
MESGSALRPARAYRRFATSRHQRKLWPYSSTSRNRVHFDQELQCALVETPTAQSMLPAIELTIPGVEVPHERPAASRVATRLCLGFSINHAQQGRTDRIEAIDRTIDLAGDPQLRILPRPEDSP